MTHATFRAGWLSRQETIEAAARKILKMLKGLASCVPELREWSCDPPPFKAIPQTAKYVSQRLEQSARRLRRPQLGYNFTAWSGTKQQSFGLRLSVGNTGRIVPNTINLNFPVDVWPNEETAKWVLSVLARVWEPEYAAYNPMQREKEHRFDLGELVFLAPETECFLGALPPQGIKREPFESGHLYTLSSSEIEQLYQQALVPRKT